MKYLFYIFTLGLSFNVSAEKIMGVEAPPCVGKPAISAEDARCIALFYGQFISTVRAFGGEWDVRAVREGKYWLIYPTKESSFVSLSTLLYKINAQTGEPSGYLPKT